jgi:transposase
MSLDQKITDFLARAEPKPTPSKLEPYAEFIRTLRQRRWSYVEIAKTLRDEFGVQAHPTTVHAFVKVRAKKKNAFTMPAPDHAAPSQPVSTAASQSSSAKRSRFHLDA